MHLTLIFRSLGLFLLLVGPLMVAQTLPLSRPVRPPRVVDAGGIPPPPPPAFQITTNAIWGAIHGQSYSAAIDTANGVPPYSWSLSSGALPPGVTLNATSGTIAGTPTGAGTFAVTLFVADMAGRVASKPLVLIVSPSDSDYGNVGNPYATEGGAPDPAAISLTACTGATALQANKSYRLANDVSAATPKDRCFNLNTGVKLDLGGRTVIGSIKLIGINASGVAVFNGTINCNVIDSGNTPGCLSISSGSTVSAQVRLHHLTITNTGEGTRSIHIDWPMTSKVAFNSMRLYNITAYVPAQPTVPRSYAISLQGLNQTPEFLNNDLTCSAQASACQGIMCFRAADCKMHHNKFTMEVNTAAGGDNGRAMLFDGFTLDGETWNNLVYVNNNRGVRIRGSYNIRIHGNKFFNVQDSGSGVIHLADPAATDTDNLNALVDNNDFELAGGTVIFIRNGINAVVRNNRFTCVGTCSGSRFAYVRSPLTVGTTFSELTVENNPSVILFLSPPQNRVDSGGVLSICNSGQAGGVGSVNPIACTP